MPFNDLKTNDVIDKGEKTRTNDAHYLNDERLFKRRTLLNDGRLFRGSNVYETDINGYKKMTFIAHTQGLCGTRVTRHLIVKRHSFIMR